MAPFALNGVIEKMRVYLRFLISGLFLIVFHASASAGPVLEYSKIQPHTAREMCSQDIYSYFFTPDIHQDKFMHLPLLFTDVRLMHVDSSQIAVAGIWSLQTLSNDVLQNTGQKSQDFLVPLFAGSLLISLSGLLKKLTKPKPGVRLIMHQAGPQASYEKMAPAQS